LKLLLAVSNMVTLLIYWCCKPRSIETQVNPMQWVRWPLQHRTHCTHPKHSQHNPVNFWTTCFFSAFLA